MTQEEKQLLLKDLCARLPYGVKAEVMGWDEEREEEVFVPVTVYSLNTDGYVYFADNDYDITYCNIDACRLYLRPMSSMTEEEKQYVRGRWCYEWDGKDIWDFIIYHKIIAESAEDLIEWFNEKHFDYRGLIRKELALEAPEGMYKTE